MQPSYEEKKLATLNGISDKTFDALIKANDENILQKDDLINFVLTMVERIVPKILKSYKGEAFERKRLGIAISLRVIISSIMPYEKFQEYMSMKEMHGVDELIKMVETKGEAESETDAIDSLFKRDDTPRDIYK